MSKVASANGLLLAAMIALLVVTSAWAGRVSQPIDIKSNELLTDSSKRTATFAGKVVARQGGLTIQSDRLVIHYTEKGGDVERVEAVGNVRMTQENRLGTADRAVYDLNQGTIVFTGTPRVQQGNDFVIGATITYYLADARSVVTGRPDKRVEAVIHPKGTAEQ